MIRTGARPSRWRTTRYLVSWSAASTAAAVPYRAARRASGRAARGASSACPGVLLVEADLAGRLGHARAGRLLEVAALAGQLGQLPLQPLAVGLQVALGDDRPMATLPGRRPGPGPGPGGALLGCHAVLRVPRPPSLIPGGPGPAGRRTEHAAGLAAQRAPPSRARSRVPDCTEAPPARPVIAAAASQRMPLFDQGRL